MPEWLAKALFWAVIALSASGTYLVAVRTYQRIREGRANKIK
ncbi:hypothetical protein [Desulfolucanica intricata]|nr:hypothetical protein [Desulfolucanica intricata]